MFKILLIHRWLSLVLGLPVALVALTGMPLALWEEADAIFAPDFYPSTPASPKDAVDRAISVVKARHPGIALDFIYFPRTSSAMHVGGTTNSGEQIELAVDGSGRQILSTRSHSGSVIGRIHAFHSHFFMQDAGRWLMLGLAWVLFVSTATGIWMWLVQRRSGRASVGIARAPSRAKVHHNAIGIWSSGLLLTMALTTIVLTWPGQSGTPAPDHARHSPTAPMAARIAQVIEIHAGTMKLRSISLRAPPDAPARAIVESSQAAPESPRDPLAAVHAQRASLWAALVHDDHDSPATREYLNAWSAGLNAIPTDRAITRADLVAIETMVILELARGGRGIAVIEKIAISRSPTKEHAKPIFLAAMDNQIVRDTLAEQGVKALRCEAKIALYNRDPQTDVGEEFVTYWEEIIDELPIDLSLPPEDYFRAIDFEVAQILVKRGHPISGVAGALAVHSPLVEAKDSQSRGEYFEDVLADLAERQGLGPGWAKAVIAAASTGDRSAAPAVASSSYAVGAPGSLTGAESIAGPMRQQMPSQQEQRPLDLVDPVSRQDPKRPPAIADAWRLPPDATLGPAR